MKGPLGPDLACAASSIALIFLQRGQSTSGTNPITIAKSERKINATSHGVMEINEGGLYSDICVKINLRRRYWRRPRPPAEIARGIGRAGGGLGGSLRAGRAFEYLLVQGSVHGITHGPVRSGGERTGTGVAPRAA